MDARTLSKLVLKLAGLYLVVSSLFNLPGLVFVPVPQEQLLPIALTLATYVVVGCALLWFPGVVVDRVIRVSALADEGALTADRLLTVGVILLGVYFAATALVSLTYWFGKFRMLSESVPFGSLSPDDKAQLLSALVQEGIGLALWFGGVRIVGALHATLKLR